MLKSEFNMKRFIIGVALATALCGQVCAQNMNEKDSYSEDNYVYVYPASIYIESNTYQGKIEIWLDNVTDNFNSYMMDLYLPEGFTIAKQSGTDDFEIKADSSKTPNHSIRVGEREGFYRIIGFALSGYIQTGDGVLLTATIEAPDTFNSLSAVAEGRLENISIAAGSGTELSHTFPNVTFPIEYRTVTGLHNVETSGIHLPADVFTVQGVCVKRYASQGDIDTLVPGIYIINGKKVIVR